MWRRWLALLVFTRLFCACEKVPLVTLDANFTRADAAYFAEEQTLFVFYRIEAKESLDDEAKIEIAYRTDTENVSWTTLTGLPAVHTHLPVDCGRKARCGSYSIKVDLAPRFVGLRMRYNPNSQLALNSSLNYYFVDLGPPHTHRSLLVYGVMDEENAHIQWRARHQFPMIRNQEAEALGLRRYFEVSDMAFGDVAWPEDNPYGYGQVRTCPDTLMPLGAPSVATEERAVFVQEELPLNASTQPVVCGLSTVTDAKGRFSTSAWAQKNPEVRPAFPTMRNPVSGTRPVRFILKFCNREFSSSHLNMQINRTQTYGATEYCIDNWRSPTFALELSSAIQRRVNAERAFGQDMSLSLALHHDDKSGNVQNAVVHALELFMPQEEAQTSPRLAGAFVFDSENYTLNNPAISRLVIWCPSNVDTLDPTTMALRDDLVVSCPISFLPFLPEIEWGPIRFALPVVLPSRSQYERYIERYSESADARVIDLKFWAPQRTPISLNVPFGEFGTSTFFNNEIMTAAPTDAFSYCSVADEIAGAYAVVKSQANPNPQPLSLLPSLHNAQPEATYDLGLSFAKPFLMQMTARVVLAASAGRVLQLPLVVGVRGPPISVDVGESLWTASEHSLRKTLTQCTRFCDHPTFNSSGQYNVLSRFRDVYAYNCYEPKFPARGDGGFPDDP